MANEIEKRNEAFLIYQDENGIAQRNTYSPTVTGLKGRCTKALEHGRCHLNSYHTPTILLPYPYY